MSDEMREALETIYKEAYNPDPEAMPLVTIANIAREALSTPDTYRVPDKENEALTQYDEEFSVDAFLDALEAMAEPPKNSLKMITIPEWLAWNLLSAHKSGGTDE